MRVPGGRRVEILQVKVGEVLVAAGVVQVTLTASCFKTSPHGSPLKVWVDLN